MMLSTSIKTAINLGSSGVTKGPADPATRGGGGGGGGAHGHRSESRRTPNAGLMH